MVKIHIDTKSRYHTATVAGHKPFTFSFTHIGFSALQKWLNEIEPSTERMYMIQPENPYSAILTRRLRSIGCQVQQQMLTHTRQKPGPNLFAPAFWTPKNKKKARN